MEELFLFTHHSDNITKHDFDFLIDHKFTILDDY